MSARHSSLDSALRETGRAGRHRSAPYKIPINQSAILSIIIIWDISCSRRSLGSGTKLSLYRDYFRSTCSLNLVRPCMTFILTFAWSVNGKKRNRYLCKGGRDRPAPLANIGSLYSLYSKWTN